MSEWNLTNSNPHQGFMLPSYQTDFDNYKRVGAWTEEEDEGLRVAMKQVKGRYFKWNEVALAIKGRSAKQCRERWHCNLNPNIIRGPWSPEEDRKLLKLHGELGNKWTRIASNLEGRSENAVKTRFKSIERAARKQWRQDEDEAILRLHEAFGPSWELIAANLPNRTKHGVKTRYQKISSGEFLKVKHGAPHQTIHLDRFGDAVVILPADKKHQKRSFTKIYHDAIEFEDLLLEMPPKRRKKEGNTCGSVDTCELNELFGFYS